MMGCPVAACLQLTARRSFEKIIRLAQAVSASCGFFLGVHVFRKSPALHVFLPFVLVVFVFLNWNQPGVETGEEIGVSLPLIVTDFKKEPLPIIFSQASSGEDLIAQLKEMQLWELSSRTEVPRIVFKGFPARLDLLEVATKKRTFLHTLLPVTMVALGEIEQERSRLQEILAGIDSGSDSVPVVAESAVLSGEERDFLLVLAEKYRTERISELIGRVDVLPVSLIMAQGAIESSWGSSRFATEGNNLFGVWTWGEKGMIPLRREEGMRHKVAIYDSILDSVRAYILTLNRLPAYKDLRKLRRRTMDSGGLAAGLLPYSERGSEYVRDVQRLINYNRLKTYDRCVLAEDARVSNRQG